MYMGHLFISPFRVQMCHLAIVPLRLELSYCTISPLGEEVSYLATTFNVGMDLILFFIKVPFL